MARAFIRTVGAQQMTEFVQPTGFLVRADSSANVNIATIANGTSFGTPAVTLATGDFVLLKDQTNSFDNGIYQIGATAGTTARHASYTTAASLSRILVLVNNQSATSGVAAVATSRFYQNNNLTNLTSDTQSWTSTPTWTYSFTVPSGVVELDILAAGGGGGGGGGGGSQSGGGNSAGAGGGAGATPQRAKYKVTPGEVLTISLGVGGNAGGRGANLANTGVLLNGTDATSTTVISTNVDMYAPGGTGGTGSASNGATTSNPGGSAFVDTATVNDSSAATPGGTGGNTTTSGLTGGTNWYHGTAAAGGVSPGAGGGGGGGGNSIDLGGAGGAGGANRTTTPPATGSRGSGGGGAGGAQNSGGFGVIGGFGGDGCVRISWGA